MRRRKGPARDAGEQVYLGEYLGRVPYMLGLRSPYYVFIGRKKPR